MGTHHSQPIRVRHWHTPTKLNQSELGLGTHSPNSTNQSSALAHTHQTQPIRARPWHTLTKLNQSEFGISTHPPKSTNQSLALAHTHQPPPIRAWWVCANAELN